MTHPKLVIPWNSPWQPKNNAALKKLSPILRKQLDAAANGSVISHIPGRRRYVQKDPGLRVRKPRGKTHLLRPDRSSLSMCGLVKKGVWLPEEVTCKICERMYAENREWYENALKEEVRK